MKNILEKFDIELSEDTIRKMNVESKHELNDFLNNGDYIKSFDELDKKEVFEIAFKSGYRNAMLDTLLFDCGDE